MRLELPLTADAEVSRDRGLETRRRTELAKLIAELPEVQAQALVLRALFGSSLAEVASGTGTSINTVRTRVRLARQRLRTRIAGDATLRELFLR